MKLIALDCNNCGAPLEVPQKLRSVTCGFCNTKLAVKHEGSAVYTEVIESIAAKVETLVQQNEIERLDREWELRRGDFEMRGKDGRTFMPSIAIGVLTMVVAGGGGLIWTMFAASMRVPVFFPMFGVLFIVVGLVMGGIIITKGRAFSGAQARYRRRRRELMRDLER